VAIKEFRSEFLKKWVQYRPVQRDKFKVMQKLRSEPIRLVSSESVKEFRSGSIKEFRSELFKKSCVGNNHGGFRRKQIRDNFRVSQKIRA
jgi:hypothetical protein